MAKGKKVIIVEKVGKDDLSIGFNFKHIDLWPVAICGILENFIKISRQKDVPEKVITTTVTEIVKLAIESAGGLGDVVDEVIEDENIS